MVSFRAARPQDTSAVLALWEQARSAQATTTDQRVDVQRLIDERPGSLLLAEADGEIVGALIAAWDGWRGNMYRLAVHPDHRRRGIALQLVRTGEAYLRDNGAHRITALVAHEDPVAAGFWESAGYPPDDVMGRRVRNL